MSFDCLRHAGTGEPVSLELGPVWNPQIPKVDDLYALPGFGRIRWARVALPEEVCESLTREHSGSVFITALPYVPQPTYGTAVHYFLEDKATVGRHVREAVVEMTPDQITAFSQ